MTIDVRPGHGQVRLDVIFGHLGEFHGKGAPGGSPVRCFHHAGLEGQVELFPGNQAGSGPQVFQEIGNGSRRNGS